MAVKLILVRHGETDWNKENRLQGTTDNPLNKNGIKQARKTAKKLHKLCIKASIIISSSLKRAMQTASVIANTLKIPIITDKNIIERGFGSLEGKSWKEICSICPDLKKKDRDQMYDYRPYGGEDSFNVKKRLLDFISFVKNNYDGKTVIVVTHAGVLRMLFYMHKDQGLDFRTEIKSAEYNILEI